MISFTESRNRRYNDQFAAFINLYPTPDSRRAVARQLLPGAARPKLIHSSHSALVSHWGDDKDHLRELAYSLYGQKDKVGSAAGGLVMAFVQGSPQDIWTSTDRLPQPVKLDIGTICEDSLLFSFPDSPSKGHRRSNELESRLRFAVGIPVIARQTLEISPSGSTVAKKPQGGEGGQVLVSYRGDISVDPDQDRYQATRTVESRPVVFGNVAVHALLKRTAEFVSGTPWENFQVLEEQAVLRAGMPLPPLGDVFSYVPVSEAASA